MLIEKSLGPGFQSTINNHTINNSLPFSPLQFIAKHMEEISIGAEQADFVFGAAAAHSVSILQIESRLAIQAEIRNVFVTAQPKFD